MFAAKDSLLTRPSGGGYQISRSLRFNSPDSAYLDRTLTTPTNNQKWTFSEWIKRSSLSTNQFILQAGNSVNDEAQLYFQTDNTIRFYQYTGSYQYDFTTVQVFRDPSAWYHLVVQYDSTQATAANRFIVYINGSQITLTTSTSVSLNATNSKVNSAVSHDIGGSNIEARWSNVYLTEINFIDGQALTPSSFGSTNADTGVWQPKAFSGTYGTNGFELNFSDNSNTTAATLGADSSGNGNNWTPNNFSVTAGVGNDSFVDSPTSYGTDTGAGGTVRGNYCTLNPLSKGTNTTLSNGNLDAVATTTWTTAIGTLGITSGKWYWEYLPISGTYFICGIVTDKQNVNTYLSESVNGFGYRWDGNKQTNGTASAYGATFTGGDVIGVAFDADAGTLVFYKNNTSQGTAFSSLTSGPYFPAVSGYSGEVYYSNFGQRPFAYTAPSGFKALCTQNLPTPTIGATTATLANKYFDINLWTGNGSSQTLTNSGGFQPDWVWTKGRSNADSNVLVNAVTGANQFLLSDSTQAEATSAALVSAFTSSGFSIGSSTSINRSSSTYVGWQWKANGAGSSNTSGSITSTVSVSTTSGFSVVTYTGTGANATVGHGLGVAPSMLIIKRRNGVTNWLVYHISIGNTKGLVLNDTQAESTDSTYWNNTSPTSSVFSLGSGGAANGSTNTHVAYCFAPIAGYSAFGSYTGNGSTDGPFVFTGFRPAFLMIKRSSSTGDWFIYNNKTSTYNVVAPYLVANTSGAEGTYTTLDFVSNGFKLRVSDAEVNGSGSTIIFMAFAENPFKFSLAR